MPAASLLSQRLRDAYVREAGEDKVVIVQGR